MQTVTPDRDDRPTNAAHYAVLPADAPPADVFDLWRDLGGSD